VPLQVITRIIVVFLALEELVPIAEDDESQEALEKRCFVWYLYSSHWLPPIFNDRLKSRLIFLAEKERCPFKTLHISDADWKEVRRVAAHWVRRPSRAKFYESLQYTGNLTEFVTDEIEANPGSLPTTVCLTFC
jgi:hypothetical protein